MTRSAQRPRNLLVWLHVVTSVAWMSQALALCALLSTGLAVDGPGKLAAFSMAEVLDVRILAHLANAGAFTGFMLAALTPWGYFRHWWVLAKFGITLSQLYLGIFVLSPNLADAVHAAGRGADGPALPLAVASALMASAIAFQAWLSIAKPWKRTPWTDAARAPRKLPGGSRRMFLLSLGAPVLDYLLGALLFGFPFPGTQLIIAVGYPIHRRRQLSAIRACAPGPAVRQPSRVD